MARKKAITIKLSEKQKNILETFAKATHVQLNLKNRAKIILQAASGITNSQISKSLGIGRESVIRWRSRYDSSYELLVKVEAEEPRRLKQAITDILSDVQRPGAPATFTDTQKAEIIALACLDPEELGLPFSHWTPQLLQVEAINRKIVDSISVSQVWRFLKSERIETSFDSDLAKPKH